MPSYLQELRKQRPALNDFSDDEIISILPKYDPQKFGNLTPDQVRFKALDDRTAFGRGLSAGVDQLQAMGGGAAALVGDVTGIDSVRDWGLDVYRRNMEEAALSAPETNFMDIDGVGDALNWAGYTLGNLAPMMATSIAGGGVGGILAKQGVQKTAAAMLANLTSKGMAKEMAKQEVGKFVAKRVALGQALGAASASSGMSSGSIYGETEDAAVSAIHGAIAGSIDALPIMRIFGRFGKTQAAKEALETSVIREIAKQGLAEASTEAVQTLVEQHANYWVENEGRSLLGNLGDADWLEIIEASAAGALGGGVMGGGASAIQRDPLYIRKPAPSAPDDDLNKAIDAANQAATQATARGGDALSAEMERARVAGETIPAAVATARRMAQELYSDPVAAPASPQTIPGQWSQPAQTGTPTSVQNAIIDPLIAAASRTGNDSAIARLEAAKRMQALSERFASEGNQQRANVMAGRAQVIVDDVSSKLPQQPEPAAGQQQEAPGERIAVWTGRRGDGYATQDAAQAGLVTRQRVRSDLDWRIEPMPSGNFQLVGYATERPVRDRMAGPDMGAIDALDSARQQGEQSRQNRMDPAREQMQGAAIDRIMRNIESRGGAATQQEADRLAEYGAGRPYDRILEQLQAPEGVQVSSTGEPFQSEDQARSSMPFRRNPGATVVPVGSGFGVQLPEPIREMTADDIRARDLKQARDQYEDAMNRAALNETVEAVEKADAIIRQFAKDSLEQGNAPMFRSTSGDMYYTVTPSSKEPGKFQITFYNDSGALSDTTINGLDEVTKEIKGTFSDPVPASEADALMERISAAEADYQKRRADYEQQLTQVGQKTDPVSPVAQADVSTITDGEIEEIQKQSKRAEVARARKRINPDKDSLAVAAIKLGGIHPQWREDITGDVKGNKSVPGVGFLFNPKGTSLDDMATKLSEAGYIPSAEMDNLGGVPWLTEMLGNELAGRGTKFGLSSDRNVEAMLAARDDQYEAQREQLEAEREAEYAQIAAEYGQEAADLAREYDDLLDNMNDDLTQEASYYEQQIQQLSDTRAAEFSDARDSSSSSARHEQVRPGDDLQNQKPAATGGRSPRAGEQSTPELILASQTEAERAAAEAETAARQNADAKHKANSRAKADADAERDDFRLSGSNAPADVANSYGQSDMLVSTRAALNAAAAEAATHPDNDLPDPTEAQKEAGNYKKGHFTLQGLEVAIENPRGSTRSGTDHDGNRWENTMAHHYGYIKRTVGADGEQVDVFIGENPDSNVVFVVDQINPDGSFDEHKVMLGFESQDDAVKGYKANYSRGWKVGPVTELSMDEFKQWLIDGDGSRPLNQDLDQAASQEAVSVSDSPDPEDKGPGVALYEPLARYSENERETSRLQSRKRHSNSAEEPAIDAGRGEQFDLFLAPEADSKSAYADLYGTIVQPRTVQVLKSATDTVKGEADLAHLLASLRKDPQENFYAVATDADGKILRVMRYTRGTKDASSVYPLDVVAEAASIEGIYRLHFAHNHPSGTADASRADVNITNIIQTYLEKIGIKPGYHVIVAGTSYGSVPSDYGLSGGAGGNIEPRLRNKSIPVTERRYTKRESLGEAITDNNIATRVTKPFTDSIVLLDNQHHPVALVRMSEKEMKHLRENKRVLRVMSAINKSNAAAAILRTNDREAAINVSRMLNAAAPELRLLDWIDDSGTSDAYTDGDVITSRGAFFARSGPGKASISIGQAKAIVSAITNRFSNAPDVIVVQSMQDQQVPEAVRREDARQRSQGASGEPEGFYYQGKAYIVLDGLTLKDGETDAQGMLRVFAHEVLGHHGLRSLFRHDLDKILMEVAMKRRGDIRRKAQEYGLDLNNRDDRLIAAEEVLAEIAQTEPKNSIVTKAIEAIRKALRAMFMALPADMKKMLEGKKFMDWINGLSDTEIIERFIIPAREYMRAGAIEKSTLAPVFQREGVEISDSGARFSRNNALNFDAPDETLTAVAIRKLQDKFKILKDLQANIVSAGGNVDSSNDAYLAEELFHGKAENDIRLMQEQYIEPLTQKMAEFGINREQLDQYLYARHAPERNAKIAEINPDMPDGGSGMTDADATVILDAANRSGKGAQYDQLAGIVYDMLALQRELVRKGGLESDSTIDAWEEKYQYYVPLKGWAEDTKADGFPRTGKGFSISGRESKRALGRSTKAASPVSFAINDLTEKLIRRRKNEVGNAFLRLVRANPNPEYWQIFTDEKPEMQRTVKKVKDPATGQMVDQVTETAVPMVMMKDRYFTTKMKGKTFYIKLEDPRLLTAMKNLGPESNNALIMTMSSITRVMAALNTSYSPEFMVSNFARDVQTALLNLHAEQSLPEGKAAGTAIAKKTMKDIPKAMKAIYAVMRRRPPKSAEAQRWHDLFEQFRADGAKTGYFDMKDLDGQAASLDRMVAIAEGGFKGKALGWAKAGTELVEHMNLSVENAVRLAAYANALDAGIPRKQAASLAKNMTVNFNRRGEVGTVLNALYMFANASIQGTANFARTMLTLKGNGKLWGNLNNAQKIALGMIAGSYFIGMANRMAAGEDEDDENWYDKVPDYVKERNIVLMKSLFGGPEDGSYYKIPLPYGYNVFSVLGGAMEAVLNGGKPVAQGAADLTLATLGAFSPIGFQDSQTAMGAFLKNAAPTLIKPAVEIGLNENFMASSIYTENLPFGTPKPNATLGRNTTPEAYRKLSLWLNEVTGGSEYRSGAVDINPDVLQHFLDYFGGSAYAFFGSKLPNTIHRAAVGVATDSNRVPFLSRIHGQVMPYADTEKFYRRRDEINQIFDEYRALPAEARSNFEDTEILKLRPLLRATERQLTALRKRRDSVYSADLALRERDPQLKAIEEQMKAAVDRFNKRYNAISD